MKKMWVLGCAFVGVFLALFLVGLDVEALPPAKNGQYLAYLVGMVVAGLIGNSLLPWALGEDRRRTLVSALVVIACGFSYFAVPACLVAFVALASRRAPLWSTLAVLAMVPAVYVDGLLNPASTAVWDWAAVLALAVPAIVGLIVGSFVGRERDKKQAQLEGVRQAERETIARDMHDSLSHRLSLIAVYAGALEDSEPAKVIRDEAAAAVQDLREVLGALRESPDPRRSIEELVDAENANGEHVELTGSVPEGLTMMRRHALHRAVQEGLTNARKHAPGEKVRIEVRPERGGVAVSMHNRATKARGSGYGLVGLKERAELSGGTFAVLDAHEEGEFGWELWLPLTAAKS